ncbi:MAG: F0F1 ATP synthase subunit B [Mariprofundaceae bacterium]|nr:F0F1 ATP synthase subunit B [Mariprofundaceae bacterium]
MPQFDTTFFSSQIFWTITSFIVLFVALDRYVLPHIAAILKKRTQLIENEIEEAHKKREEAETIKSEYTARLADIDQETKKMFAESEKRMSAQHNQMMDEWKTEMERRKRTFLEEAEVTRQQAIRDIRSQSAELVATATEQIIHQRVDKAEAQKALDESITELEKYKKN